MKKIISLQFYSIKIFKTNLTELRINDFKLLITWFRKQKFNFQNCQYMFISIIDSI